MSRYAPDHLGYSTINKNLSYSYRDKFADLHLRTLIDDPTAYIDYLHTEPRRLPDVSNFSSSKKFRERQINYTGLSYSNSNTSLRHQVTSKQSAQNQDVLKKCTGIVQENFKQIAAMVAEQNKKRAEQEKQNIDTVVHIMNEKYEKLAQKIEKLQAEGSRCQCIEKTSVESTRDELIDLTRHELREYEQRLHKQIYELKRLDEFQFSLVKKQLADREAILKKQFDKLLENSSKPFEEVRFTIMDFEDRFKKIQSLLSAFSTPHKNQNAVNIAETIRSAQLDENMVPESKRTADLEYSQDVRKELREVLDKISIHSNKINLLSNQVTQVKESNLHTLSDFKQSIQFRLQEYEKAEQSRVQSVYKSISNASLINNQKLEKVENMVHRMLERKGSVSVGDSLNAASLSLSVTLPDPILVKERSLHFKQTQSHVEQSQDYMQQSEELSSPKVLLRPPELGNTQVIGELRGTSQILNSEVFDEVPMVEEKAVEDEEP